MPEAERDGPGIIHLFEGWLRPHPDNGTPVPVLEPWRQSFSDPFLHGSGRRHRLSLRSAFVGFIRESRSTVLP